jgi:putative acetyltransferase
MRIIAGDFSNSQIIALLEYHVAAARSATAPGSDHALDLKGLQSPDIHFWALWDDENLLGLGALKIMSPEQGKSSEQGQSPDHGEVKSMHIVREARGQGLGHKMMRHIIDAARKQGLRRLSLETGSWDYFVPAVKLYEAHGFQHCPPFADYKPDPNSLFLTRLL